MRLPKANRVRREVARVAGPKSGIANSSKKVCRARCPQVMRACVYFGQRTLQPALSHALPGQVLRCLLAAFVRGLSAP